MIGESSIDTNMAIEEECSKQKEDSPALTEATTYTSSPESSPDDESKNLSIRRKLFKDSDPPKDTIDSPSAFDSPSAGSVIRKAVLTPRGSENGLADTTSITSSETTAIPSWNLSMKDATETNVEVPLENFILSQSIPLMTPPPYFPVNQIRPILSSPSSFASDETQRSGEDQPQLSDNKPFLNYPNNLDDKENVDVETKETNKPSVVMEDPPEQPTSCNAALNLAEIVLAFGQSARQRYQGSEQTENTEAASVDKAVDSKERDPLIWSPPPIMTSRHLSESSSQSEKSQSNAVQSIEQELNTMKTNAKRDAYMISKLQQAVETQKQLNSLKEVEIVDRQAELQVSSNRTRRLEKEQEDYLERETEQRETINILKKELDKMTLLNTAPSDELDHLKLESEPSSDQAESRVKDQQARIEELERHLQEKEKENFDLQKKIDWLNDQRQEGTKYDQCQLDKEEVSANDEIESRLTDIMKRLEAVEIEKREMEVDRAKRSEENRNEETNILNESEHNGVKIDVSEDPDEIEATTLKDQAKNNVDPGKQLTWCCDWNLVSGQ